MSTTDNPEKRFAVDIMLGKLAKWLRVLGFDAAVQPIRDPELVEKLLAEGIVPVTRREKMRETQGIVFIRSDHLFEQLRELITALDLKGSDLKPFSRCSVCNSPLFGITREAAFGGVPDFVFETATDFRKCPECGRIYWPGTHKTRMLEKLQSIIGWERPEEGEDAGE